MISIAKNPEIVASIIPSALVLAAKKKKV